MAQTIYHGSYTIIEQPKLMDGRFTKDFGNGFYCTTLKHQAARWAGRYDTPIVNIYEYQENPSLKIKKFVDLTDGMVRLRSSMPVRKATWLRYSHWSYGRRSDIQLRSRFHEWDLYKGAILGNGKIQVPY